MRFIVIFLLTSMVVFNTFGATPSETDITIGDTVQTDILPNGRAPYFYGTFDAGGFSDWIYYGRSTIHQYSYHEVLSGEWGAAIYYDGIDTSPIDALDPNSPYQAMWLTDYFDYPYWTTNSDFQITGTPTSYNDSSNPTPLNNTAISKIVNGDIEVTIDYEVVDINYDDPNDGVWTGSPIELFTDGSSAIIFSDRYLFLQTYTIRNITEQTISGFEFYQMLHSHGADEYNAAVYSTYCNTGAYYDPLSNYTPYNTIHTVGDFKYDITQWNDIDAPNATKTHTDYVCFSSTTMPDFVENGYYIGGHSYASENKPPRPGTHWNIEDRDLNGELESFGEVAGAMGWELGDLDPNETTSITVAFMFGHGEPVVCSLDVDIDNIVDPNSLVDYCGIDPLNGDPNYYTVEYSIDYGNPITDSGAVDYLGTLTDVVLTAELGEHIWPMPGDVVAYNGGSYNLIGRSITWDIGTLAPGASGTVYFTIKIMDTAEPGGEIITSAKLSSEKGWVRDSEYSAVCCFCDTVYVDADAYGGYSANGSSWSHAYPSLAAAFERITSTSCGDEIWIAKGTYQPADDEPFAIVDDVPLYGGFAGEPNETSLNDRDILTNTTTLSAGDADYVIDVSNYDNVTIDGLTITGGSSAGLKFSSTDIAINNCIIAGNGAKGIEISSSDLTLTKSLVSDNGGDGVYSSNSKLTINQSMLRSNTESGLQMSSSDSGSIVANSIITDNGDIGINNTSGSNTVTVTNCSIIANGSHGASGDEDVDIINSIVWNNGPIEDPNTIYTYQDKVQAVECNVSYSCVQDPNDIEGLESGADTPDIDGNISAVPQFYFEPSSFVYYLRNTSPCRDAGDNNSIVGTTDYYSQSRTINTTVDMGAVEYNGSQICDDCDFNDSAAVDFIDYLPFANSWLAEDTDTNYDIACDLSPNDVIDDDDLIEFADCWLWEPAFISTNDVMQIAHRDTHLEAIEPVEMMGMSMAMTTLPTQSISYTRDGSVILSADSQTVITEESETYSVSGTGTKQMPQSAEAAKIAETIYLLDAIYIDLSTMSEEDYLQYQQFKQNLETTYYQLITPQ